MTKTAIAPALALAALALSAHAADARGSTATAPAGPTAVAQATTGGPAATPAPGATNSTAPSTAAMGAGPAASSAGGDKGQAVFAQTCVACHGAGVAGAPKVGDKADWGPRVAQGKDVLYQHALQGFTGKKGVMPPKGGNTALADADVKAAVDYMAAQVK